MLYMWLNITIYRADQIQQKIKYILILEQSIKQRKRITLLCPST